MTNKKYKILLAHPGRQHSFRVAKALKDYGFLFKYITTVYNKDDSLFMKFAKIILSKDGTGEVTNYQLEAEVIFLIKSNNKEIKITERKIIDSMSDKFEEARYERSIKQNFATSITNKLTSELIIN